MKTVYVEITDNYSRTVWDNTGATNYVVGDRIEYNDGSRNRIFVCINNNNSTTEPQNNPTDWAPAGSKEYPFLLIDSTNNLRVITNSEWTLFGTASSTVNFLVEELGTWTPDNPIGGGNATYQADGAGGTIILGDGRYAWDYNTYAMWWPSNCTIQAKNKQKAYIIVNAPYFAGNNVIWKDVVFYNTYNTNVIPGAYSAYKHSLDSCLSTQETPWGTLAPAKQDPSSGSWIRVLGNWNGGYIKNCTFDYQYIGPSYFMNVSGGSGAVFENNTVYIRVKHNQYNLIYNSGYVTLKNNIFYIKYLRDVHLNQDLTRLGSATQGTNSFYLENDSDAGGTINNNLSGGTTIDPQFIDADNGNFSLRPSSPLIGGLKEQNELLQKYPNGLWVDHNHSPTQASYNYTLDSGDGNNYTFSGDATGTDPVLSANIQDTLTFTNNTGGHPLAIYNSQGVEVASESGGTTTFTPKYPDTYYYQCTVSGHEDMRGDIVVTKGTLGSYDNPFGGMYDAIDAGYYDNSAVLLFKEGDHELYFQNPGNYGSSNTSISSSFPGGLSFIGKDPATTRFTSGNNLNGYAAFYLSSANFTDSPQSKTPLTIDKVGFHINNSSSYLNRGLFSGLHWKSFSLISSKVTCDLASGTNSNPFDYFSSIASGGYEFTLSGCEFNIPLSDNNGPGGSFLSGNAGIKYSVDSCSFIKLSGYNYVHNGPSPIMLGGSFSSSNGSYIKNSIFYSEVGGNFGGYSISSGVFSKCAIHSTTNSFVNLPPDMHLNSSSDPLFVKTSAGEEDLRLKPKSELIGGLKKQETNVYYLQPGNPLNGDGSQKDASAMTADGDPGPFNAFKNIVAAGIPYGSKVVILNGTYSWPDEFHIQKNTANWQDYTYEGYEYHAETKNEVIFDGLMTAKTIGYYGYGGTSGAGVYLDLHTSFNGIQFNRSNNGLAWPTASTSIYSSTDIPGKGSCTFNACKFLGWIMNGVYSWTGAARSRFSSSMHWENCEIVIAFQASSGRLLSGEDGHANDVNDPNWSWENCVFYTPVGATTFYGVNASGGTYFSPQYIFGNLYEQTSRIFKNNILHFPGGNSLIGPNNVTKLPQINNNVFNGFNVESHLQDAIDNGNNFINIDPKFLNPENNNFNLRPNSLLVGRGI